MTHTIFHITGGNLREPSFPPKPEYVESRQPQQIVITAQAGTQPISPQVCATVNAMRRKKETLKMTKRTGDVIENKGRLENEPN